MAQDQTPVEWAHDELGPASAAYVGSPQPAQAIADMIDAGASLEHAVVSVVHAEIRNDRELENEFVGFILPIALRLAQRSINSMRLLKNTMDEEDVAHSMMGNFYEDLHEVRFESIEHLVNHIALRVRNRAFDQYRKLTSEKRSEQRRAPRPPEELAHDAAPSADDPVRQAMLAEARELFLEAKATLPVEKQALIDYSTRGVSSADVAEALGKTAAAVRVATRRAWAELASAVDRIRRQRCD